MQQLGVLAVNGLVAGFLFGIGLIIASFVMKWIFHIGFCG